MRLRERNSAAAPADQQAVIDIGSNTVRLVIYGGPPRAPVELLNEKVAAKLGKGVARQLPPGFRQEYLLAHLLEHFRPHHEK